ncbi:MAG TPA: MFS transporter [Stellaceae bacterium]|nr:MFS transporter [Stellaceae bacterium]
MTQSVAPDDVPSAAVASERHPRGGRVLAACCGAHVLHDGYSDLLYVLLPVWQAEFGLALAQVGLLRSVYSGAMASLQVPAGLLAERLGERGLLALGTAIAASAFLLAGWSGGYIALIGCLALGGLGASVQHPLSSALTARAFAGARLRTALSTYNFSGDVGKMLFPAVTAWLVAAWHWRAASQCVGLVGLAVAVLLLALLPKPADIGKALTSRAGDQGSVVVLPARMARLGFVSLSLIGVLDSATRMGFLTLLPFVLSGKGASLPTIGTALTLVFAGGATGKFVCGVLAARVGVLCTVILTEGGTALGILALLPLPLTAAYFLLPLIGVALNGTSSVLYGTVPELAPAERRARAFAVFYTCTIGAGAIAPWLYGWVSDGIGLTATLALISVAVLLVLPLSLPLRPILRRLGGTR